MAMTFTQTRNASPVNDDTNEHQVQYDLLWANDAAVATTAGSGDFTSPVADVGIGRNMVLNLNVTASTGADETLDVTVQYSDDQVTWATNGVFAQVTGAGTERQSFIALGRYIRHSFNFGGTGTFTFNISGMRTA